MGAAVRAEGWEGAVTAEEATVAVVRVAAGWVKAH